MTTISEQSVLDGRLQVNVYTGQKHTASGYYTGPLISIGSLGNRSGSMTLTPLELASLLDGPLDRALTEANRAA